MQRSLSCIFGSGLRVVALVAAVAGAYGCAVDHGSGPGAADGGSSVCPARAPSADSPCQAGGQRCEYGGDRFGRCSLLASCAFDFERAHLTWQLLQQPGCDTAPACPANFDSLAKNADCPAELTTACDYPDDRCRCAACLDLETQSTRREWQCTPLDDATCVYKDSLRLGDACDPSNAEQCVVGSCGDWIRSQACVDGRWKGINQNFACVFPACRRR